MSVLATRSCALRDRGSYTVTDVHNCYSGVDGDCPVATKPPKAVFSVHLGCVPNGVSAVKLAWDKACPQKPLDWWNDECKVEATHLKDGV